MKLSVIPCLLLILISSCKKEDAPITNDCLPVFETERYAPFNIGSYWIYQKFTIDPITMIETPLNEYDSLYISSKETINGIEYSRMEGLKFGQFVVNNQIGVDGAKLIDPNGNVFLNVLATNDTVSMVSGSFPIDSIATVFRSEITSLILPFGTLSSGHSKELIFYQASPFPSPLFERDFFSKDIGLVVYTTFYGSSGLIVEMRLVNYFINP